MPCAPSVVGSLSRSPQPAAPFSTNERGWTLAISGRRVLTGRVNGAISRRETGVNGVINRGVEWFLGFFRWLAWPFLVLTMLEQPPVLFKLL